MSLPAAFLAPTVRASSAERSSSSTKPYWSARQSGATWRKFFAEARTMAGPPMSICSMTSASGAPEATVWRKG